VEPLKLSVCGATYNLNQTSCIIQSRTGARKRPTLTNLGFQLLVLTIQESTSAEKFVGEIGSESKSQGRLLSLDIGTKRIGVAVSDELRITVRPLPPIQRTSWKHLLLEVRRMVAEFDARAIVIGLPLRLDGTEGDAAHEARRTAEKFQLSLAIPVYLQDERLSTVAAHEALKKSGKSAQEIADLIDSEAAVLILREFMGREFS
jgi:putative holliday junction resolvase